MYKKQRWLSWTINLFTYINFLLSLSPSNMYLLNIRWCAPDEEHEAVLENICATTYVKFQTALNTVMQCKYLFALKACFQDAAKS